MKLSPEQLEDLRQTLAKQVVDGMDIKVLEQFAYEQLHAYYSTLSEESLMEVTRNVFGEDATVEDIIPF